MRLNNWVLAHKQLEKIIRAATRLKTLGALRDTMSDHVQEAGKTSFSNAALYWVESTTEPTNAATAVIAAAVSLMPPKPVGSLACKNWCPSIRVPLSGHIQALIKLFDGVARWGRYGGQS